MKILKCPTHTFCQSVGKTTTTKTTLQGVVLFQFYDKNDKTNNTKDIYLYYIVNFTPFNEFLL